MSRTYRIRHGDLTHKYYMVIDSDSPSPGLTVMDEFNARQYGTKHWCSFWKIPGVITLDEYNKAAMSLCSKDGRYTHGGNAGPWHYRNQFHRKFRRRDRRSIQKYLNGLSDDVMLCRNVFPGYWW